MKQNIVRSLGLFLIAWTWSMTLLAQDYGGYVKYSGSSTPGVITVISNGFGKNIRTSTGNALAGAFYTLLFKGLPGSANELPMVPNEEEKKTDSTIVALLNGGYNAFVMEDITQNQVKTTKKQDGVTGVSTTHLITINCTSLRRYLEEKSVVRKFGN
jgi:hypothetical protein